MFSQHIVSDCKVIGRLRCVFKHTGGSACVRISHFPLAVIFWKLSLHFWQTQYVVNSFPKKHLKVKSLYSPPDLWCYFSMASTPFNAPRGRCEVWGLGDFFLQLRKPRAMKDQDCRRNLEEYHRTNMSNLWIGFSLSAVSIVFFSKLTWQLMLGRHDFFWDSIHCRCEVSVSGRERLLSRSWI